MRTFAAGIIVVLAVLVVAAQLALPAFFESQVRSRLEKGGGSADVSVNAFPAITLIGGSGEEVDVHGRDLRFDLSERSERPFDRLDGFERVAVDLRNSQAGAARVTRFKLTRDGRDEPYDLVVSGAMTPAALGRELGSTAAGPLGGVLGGLAGGLVPGGGSVPVPLRLNARVNSQDGRTEVVDASASVAGVSAGPLAEVVLGSVLDRL